MNSDNLTQFPSRFVSYPTNRLLAHFNSKEQVRALLPEIEKQGVDLKSVYILDGQEGLDALDTSGEEHGTFAKMSRVIHKGGSITEREKLESVAENLSEGGITVAVHARDKALRYALIDLYQSYGGREITYAARFYIEDFKKEH